MIRPEIRAEIDALEELFCAYAQRAAILDADTLRYWGSVLERLSRRLFERANTLEGTCQPAGPATPPSSGSPSPAGGTAH